MIANAFSAGAPSVGTLATPFVDSPKQRPPFFSEKSELPRMGAADFKDAAYWDSLANRYLGRYDLPRWDIAPNPESLARWLDRLDMPISSFLETGAYRNLQDATNLNPRWPLRALIGLSLELKANPA